MIRIFKTNGFKLLVALLLGGALWYWVDFITAFFWFVFVVFIFYRIDSKYVGQAALLCLVFLPFLLLAHNQAVAEQVAVYAYFLLVITVALQMVALKRQPKAASQMPAPEPPLALQDTQQPEVVHPKPTARRRVVEGIRKVRRLRLPRNHD